MEYWYMPIIPSLTFFPSIIKLKLSGGKGTDANYLHKDLIAISSQQSHSFLLLIALNLTFPKYVWKTEINSVLALGLMQKR